jgi:hypothetical protein
VCTVSGTTVKGSFIRNGPLVTVDLDATITLCYGAPLSSVVTPPCHTVGAHIKVVALFVPTAGNGVTAPITQAAFAGVFIVGPLSQ